MRRDYKVDPRKSKIIARQRYAQRQIEKWIKWSWEIKGKIKYKELVKQQDEYKMKCYVWTRR